MAWVYLFIAGLAEVASVPFLKESAGLTRIRPAAAAGIALVLSFYCLSKSIRSIPVGTAYAVWTGIGSCGAVVTGILLYGESVKASKLICVAFIIIGMIGLKLTS
ncbi:multidrug efflux SMR transporter [Paenibacillus sp. BR2-3]|uniref:DMT family transporter n=1 Tax=Paenibacillus sp. BR2-3 TaxID=3048494 RepID=UPI0039774017